MEIVSTKQLILLLQVLQIQNAILSHRDTHICIRVVNCTRDKKTYYYQVTLLLFILFTSKEGGMHFNFRRLLHKLSVLVLLC